MSTVSVLNMEGNEVGTMELNDAIFGVEVNEHLVHRAVVQQLANNRQGTQSAKTRSEVRGGVVFAPKPRDYSFKMNKKEKRAALKSALTSRVQEEKFIVLDELALDEIKTKKFVQIMKNLNVEKALVVLADGDINVVKSAANIPAVKTALTNSINVYDILKYNTVVTTKAAVAVIEEVYA